MFFLTDFKLCKCCKQGFCLEGSASQLSDPTLVKKSSALVILLVLFKLSCFYVTVRLWCLINEPLKDSPAVVQVALSLFKLKVRVPRVLLRVPGHPVFKDSAHSVNLAKHLFHQRILKPKLVDPWQMLAGPLPHISSRLDMFEPHLHVCILKPQGDMLEVYSDCSFEDGPRAEDFANGRFPLCILLPSAHVVLLLP